MKVALIHYWLLHMRGGEKVLEAIGELYPDADIYTHVVDREKISPSLLKHKIYTTFISRLPMAKKMYQSYLPLMPWALEALDLREYDLVISVESGPAKGVLTRPDAVHMTYCCSPMRYVWDMAPDYLATLGKAKRFLLQGLLPILRAWDRLTADRVDDFVSVSRFIGNRIYSYYRRESYVVYPPVEVDDFLPIENPSEDFYLVLGQLVGYKRADLAVRAFAKNGKKLVIVGEGEQMELLKTIATPNIALVGRLPFEEIRRLYQNCKALVFPGVEDFGIVPLEAQACGRPVIAFADGGALETVEDGVTGVYFHSQTEESLNLAVETFEKTFKIDPVRIRENAMRFSKANFKEKFSQRVRRVMELKKEKRFITE